MAHSMTAFAKVQLNHPQFEANMELRSVNHRYLEVACRLPEPARHLDIAFKEQLKKKLSRGKLELSVQVKLSEQQTPKPSLNDALANELIHLAQQLEHKGVQGDLKAMDLMRWPEVVSFEKADIDFQAPLQALLEQAVGELIEYRQREGHALVTIIQEKLALMSTQVEKAIQLWPSIEQDYRNKLTDQLEQLAVKVEAERFEQEVVLFLNRADIQEEIDRLKVHIKETSRLLEQKGPIGRKLDFMMQELNREANTLGSKSSNLELTNVAVELKVLIEQIREQIQNLE